jgi:hypothetical protein
VNESKLRKLRDIPAEREILVSVLGARYYAPPGIADPTKYTFPSCRQKRAVPEGGQPMTVIHYQDVFGVPLGSEVQEAHGVTYKPCPAVESLRGELLAIPFFTAGKVGGMGPLFRMPGFKHEFNRHHAGLAVDIMLNPGSDDEEALGHHLVKLFVTLAGVMNWRGLIYQDITIDLNGAVRTAGRWSKGGHDDHIHIDWHNSLNVTKQSGISQIPLRRRGGDVVQMVPMEGDSIAESIQWSAEAMTSFKANPALQNGLQTLMNNFRSLPKLNLSAELGITSAPASSYIGNDLQGKWTASIGPWNGIFFFDLGGGVYWADSDTSPKHRGRWTATASEVQWKFNDPGDIRVFTVPLPVSRKSAQVTVQPAGQGAFTMSHA